MKKNQSTLLLVWYYEKSCKVQTLTEFYNRFPANGLEWATAIWFGCAGQVSKLENGSRAIIGRRYKNYWGMFYKIYFTEESPSKEKTETFQRRKRCCWGDTFYGDGRLENSIKTMNKHLVFTATYWTIQMRLHDQWKFRLGSEYINKKWGSKQPDQAPNTQQ